MLFPKTLLCAAAICLPVLVSAGTTENTLVIDDLGDNTLFEAIQTLDAGNVARVSISGRDNGGSPGGLWHVDPAGLFSSALTPGRLIQDGLGHTADIAISGNNNLFAASQSGSNHNLTGTVLGQYNQASVVQTGMGHAAVFNQAGQRNSLSIRQSSW